LSYPAGCGGDGLPCGCGGARPGGLARPSHLARAKATKDDLDPSRTYGAPTLVVDPADPLTVVAGFADLRTRRCGLRRSTDGGQTWKLLDASPSPASYQFCLVPSQKVPQTLLAFGRNHTLYYALFGWDVQDGGTRQRTSIFLARSTDLGDSWQTSVVRDARPLEKEANRPLGALAVDTKSGTEDVIYLSWDRYGVFGGAVGPVSMGLMAVSTDGGKTFSDPIDVTGGYFNASEARAEALKSAPAPAPGSRPSRRLRVPLNARPPTWPPTSAAPTPGLPSTPRARCS